jgi:hypothetical protein
MYYGSEDETPKVLSSRRIYNFTNAQVIAMGCVLFAVEGLILYWCW